MHTKTVLAVVVLLLVPAASVGASGLTLTGKVVDSSGRSIPGATVMVYHAGVLSGYSTLCPSCYKDCGKRAKTDASGAYTINNLEHGLWFDILVVHEGYVPEIIKIEDASAGPAPRATLRKRPSTISPSHAVKGHVLDANGDAVRDAVVTAVGVEGEQGSMVGTIPGLDPLAVTDPNGDFQLVCEMPLKRVLVTIEARTLSLKFVTLVTGAERQTIELTRGATIKGRLVQDGKPVGDAEIGLIGQRRGGFGKKLTIVGDPYPEIRVGTQQDGTFVISDVPAGVQWFVYAKMESVAPRGSSEAKTCLTPRAGAIVDVGDMQVGRGYRFQGKVILSDAKSVPDGMRVIIISAHVWDSQTALLDKDGRFKFVGLPKGEYSISPAVKGYKLPGDQREIQASIQQDVDNFTISLSPEQPKR
jgi:hypothetical protein